MTKREARSRKKVRRYAESVGCLCVYCDNPFPPMTLDHYVPLAVGGRTDVDNLVPACLECNGRKSNGNPDEVLSEEERRRARVFISTMLTVVAVGRLRHGRTPTKAALRSIKP